MGFLPPQATGEKDVLTSYLFQQLAQLRTTVHGLDDEQAHATPTASDLNLTGLLRHCGLVVAWWTSIVEQRSALPDLPDGIGADRRVADVVADPASLEETLAFFDRCVALARQNLASLADLSFPVPVPEAPWLPPELESWEARWVLLHLCTEVARHTGHADIIRETLDGKGAFQLNDEVDGTNWADM